MRWKLSLAALALTMMIGGSAQAATFVVNRFDDPAPLPAPNGCNTGGSCSLREAVLAANVLPDLDTIQLGAGTYDLSIPEAGTPETGDLDVDFSAIFQGEGPGATIVNGVQPALNDRLIEVTGFGGIFSINGLTLQNGSAGDGGGLYQPSPGYAVTLSQCEFRQNRAVSNGGGVYLASAATIENCNIEGNTVDSGAGGGVYFSSGGSLSISNSSVNGNTVTAGGAGGGLYFSAGGSLQATQSQFNGNIMDGGSGSGLFCSGSGPMVLSGVETSGNTLTNGGTGAGINCSGSTIFAEGLTANGNTLGAGGSGAGAFLSASTVSVSGLTVVGNQIPSGGSGGGAYITSGSITLDTVTASGNTIQGGGIAAGLYLSTGTLILADSVVDGNSAEYYGGIYASTSAAEFTNLTVTGNLAERDGGGIYISSGDAQFNNLTVTDNQADANNVGAGSGGGIFNSGILTLRNSILSGNTANAGMGPDCFGGPITSDGYNIIGSDADCAITPPQGDPASTDLYGVDPLLGPLADNGGPTQTRALLAGSPAIDGGDPAGCVDGNGSAVTTDQRGQIRPSGPRCDIGAFELGSSDLEIVKTASAAQVDTGDEFSYTLTITNNGPGKNFDIEVSDAVPAELALVSVGSDQADCSSAGNTVTCTLAELDAGDSFVVEIIVAANEEGDVENTATVQGSEQDPDPANNTSSVLVSVGPANPDLSGGGCAISGATPSRYGTWTALGAAALLAAAWRLRRSRLAE